MSDDRNSPDCPDCGTVTVRRSPTQLDPPLAVRYKCLNCGTELVNRMDGEGDVKDTNAP